MEVFGLRRTQSLKNMPGVHERSWAMPDPTRWDRKSVSQMVQHYQSWADLRSDENQEHSLQEPESCGDSGWRKVERRETASHWRNRNTSLVRSCSMDFHPLTEPTGTKALRALFESKADLEKSLSSSSSPRLNTTTAAGNKAGRERPLQELGRTSTPVKQTIIQTQKTHQVDGRKTTNGLPESYSRASRYSHDDKRSSPLKKGGTPTRQSREPGLSSSSSVRDRSALYLSKTAAATSDSTGGSAQPEFIETPRKRPKSYKFESPAKEICSACLTPVYPMEKMMANKHVLHKNCFCCQQCQRKLSLHNYSFHNGEFYCISHYQQLSKNENYNEGFGYKQQKEQLLQKQKDEPKVASAPKTTKSNISKQYEERWLQKNKGTDELDVASTPKISKTIVKKSESSAQVLVTKTPAKVVGRDSGGDVKGKLKINWPPEKKSVGVSPTQQIYEKNKTPGIGKVPTYSPRHAEKTQTKITADVEIKKKVTTLSSSFVSGVKEQSKTTGSILPEKEIKPKSETSISERVLKFSVASPGKTLTVTNQKAEQKSLSPTFKTKNRPPSNWLDVHSIKDRKSVGFSPSAARSDSSPQLIPTTAKVKELSEKLPEQTQQSKVSKPKDENRKVTVSEFSPQQSSSEVYLEIPDYKSPERPRATAKPRKDSGDEEKSSEDEAEKSLQGFTAGSSSTENVVNHKPELLHVIPKESVSPSEPEKTNTTHSREEATSETHGKPSEKTDSASEQENGGSQKKPANKLMKLGSFSLGKGPLSKLFTSSGNDKANKTEPKDTKKPEAKPRHFGILFQSSSEQFENKMAAQDERKEKTDIQEKKTEEAEQEKTHPAEPNTQQNQILVVHDERQDKTHADETKMQEGEMTVTWEMHKDSELAQLVLEHKVDAQEKPRSPEPEQTTTLEIKHETEDKTQKAEETVKEASNDSEEENQEEDEEFVPEKSHPAEPTTPEESEAEETPEEEEQDAKRDKRHSDEQETEMQKENSKSETPERSHSAEESDTEETVKGEVQDENEYKRQTDETQTEETVKEGGNWSEEEHQEKTGEFVLEKPHPAEPSALDESEAEETPEEEDEQDNKREKRQTDETVKEESNWSEEENQEEAEEFVPEKPHPAELATPEESDTEETTKREVQDENEYKTNEMKTEETAKEEGNWSEEENQGEAGEFVLEKPHPAEPSALDDSEAEETPEEEEQDAKRDTRHSDEETEMQKDKDESETPERSHSPESSTLENESLHLLQASAGETQHHTAPHPTDANLTPDDQGPVFQSRETTDLFVTDPPSAVSQDWNVSIHHSAAETNSEEALTASFSDGILGVSVSSIPGNHPTIQISADEATEKSNEPLEASSDEEPDQDPSSPQETFVPAAPPEATSHDAFNLFDSDQTDQATAEQHTSNPFLISSQTVEQQGTDFDIFSSNDLLFSQPPPAAAAADASTNQAAFLDDFFGVSNLSNAAPPSSSATSDSLDVLLGPDTSSTAAPSAQTDLFALDIFATEAKALPASEPSDANVFLDSLLESNNNNNNTEQTGNTVTSSSSNSWMDDLLG